MKIYTKTGDNGTTSLVGGQRIAKNDNRLEAYGNVDELNSFVGLLKAKIDDDNVRQILHDIQNTLLCIGANLATDTATTPVSPSAKISPKKTLDLEKNIDFFNDSLPKIRNFIIYGDDELSALCHVCRAVARRTERSLFRVDNQELIDDETKKYLNRLSDFLFVLARHLTIKNKKNEIFWIKS